MPLFTTISRLFRRVLPAIALTAGLLQSATAQTTFTRVPSPNPSTTRNQLRGISGTSSTDIWTVGHYEAAPGSNKPMNLILHWNGTGWQAFPSTNLSTVWNDLWDVEAISPTDAWAVGQYDNLTRPQLLRWNGTAWSQQTLPNPTLNAYLFSLDAISPNDVWAVGGKTGSPFSNYAVHYNGSSWTEIPVPNPGAGRNNLNSVHGIAANDVWAVGSWGVAVGDYHYVALHWNGSSWTNVTLPNINNGVDGELTDVKMVSANDVWAVGYSLAGGIVLIHWNGTAWTEVPATGGGGALAVLGPNNVYGVGGDIAHWNGSSWTVVDTLFHYPYPSLVATTVLPNGEIWAAGRTVDSSNVFQTLVYRTGANPISTGTGITAKEGSWLSVFPNPFDGSALIQLTGQPDVPIRLSLTDAAGRVVWQQEVTLKGTTERVPLDAGKSMPAGMYLLRAVGAERSETVRLLRK